MLSRKTLILLMAWSLVAGPAFSCTIFYINRNGTILGGNNEDWKDPYTRFWIYPATEGKNAWIKFGFGSGFPQGGMNDHGLFWDATGCVWLAMPEAEKNKQEYQGALMQKVMEECGSVHQAIDLFYAYYCQDQYKAQYLLGDSLGYSMIVEGDNIILNDTAFQVLTNFYQSHPELGGYPCWRYETAVDLLGNSSESSAYLAGTVLASTHQEGTYPTQYSNIYELQKCRVYLFYYHNYEEYLSIDLIGESAGGYASYDIPLLFSKIKMLEPVFDQDAPSSSVMLKWLGRENSSYEIVYADNPSFSNSTSMQAGTASPSSSNNKPLLALIPAGIFFLMLGIKKKQTLKYAFLTVIIVLSAGTRCNRDDGNNGDTDVSEHTCSLSSLKSGTTYYWKIRAMTEESVVFQTESLAGSFTTQSD